jgi:hypothetical protein
MTSAWRTLIALFVELLPLHVQLAGLDLEQGVGLLAD